jgi:pimeloyl-ACP methyl ester carboxylesterase
MTLFMRITLAVLAVLTIATTGFVVDANIRIDREEILPADEAAPGRFLMVGEHRLHVATVGNPEADPTGAPLLLIHGFIASGGTTWMPWASKLAALRSLIIPDLLGYGHSERQTVPGTYFSLKSEAASLADLLDQVGAPVVDIVGHSTGGALAAQFALDYPDRVRRIVFMDAAIAEPHDTSEDLVALPLGIGRAIAWHTFGGGPFGEIAKHCRSQPNCRWLYPLRIRDTTDSLRAMIASRRASPDGAALRTRIDQIGQPSLVIWGANDTAVPVAQGDRLARELKTNIAIIAGAGHMPFLAQPDRVAERIQSFLQPEQPG